MPQPRSAARAHRSAGVRRPCDAPAHLRLPARPQNGTTTLVVVPPSHANLINIPDSNGTMVVSASAPLVVDSRGNMAIDPLGALQINTLQVMAPGAAAQSPPMLGTLAANPTAGGADGSRLGPGLVLAGSASTRAQGGSYVAVEGGEASGTGATGGAVYVTGGAGSAASGGTGGPVVLGGGIARGTSGCNPSSFTCGTLTVTAAVYNAVLHGCEAGASPASSGRLCNGLQVNNAQYQAVLTGPCTQACGGGSAAIAGGDAVGGAGGAITLTAGASSSADGGTITLRAGTSGAAGGGALHLFSGQGATSSGELTLRTGDSSGGGSGAISLITGAASSPGVRRPPACPPTHLCAPSCVHCVRCPNPSPAAGPAALDPAPDGGDGRCRVLGDPSCWRWARAARPPAAR